jgi:chromosome segregation ATPase
LHYLYKVLSLYSQNNNNMKAEHSPEPWKAKASYIQDVNERFIVVEPIDTTIEEDVHNISRIVECVNALADLTTEQIEELKVWLKTQSTTLMFDYVAKNRLLEAENTKLKEEIEEWNKYSKAANEQIEDRNSYITKLQTQLEEYKTMESLHKSSSHDIRMLYLEIERLNSNQAAQLLVRSELTEQIEKLQAENIKLRNCGNCKHEYAPFIEETPCLGCCSTEHSFLNWEGK